jgi:hypothetical protein
LIFEAQYEHPEANIGSCNRKIILERITAALQRAIPIRATAISVLASIGRNASMEHDGFVLEQLLLQLGSSSPPLKALAYVQASSGVYSADTSF